MTNYFTLIFFINTLIFSQHLMPMVTVDSVGAIKEIEYYRIKTNKISLVKKEEITFKNGKKNGLFYGWYENGNKKCEINYKNDFKDGLCIYWYQNGNKKGEENWDSSIPIGLWTQWHENGRPYSESVFRAGSLTSKDCWDEKGSKIDCLY